MHIEKNVCESIIGTLLNIPGKTNDGLNYRLDLVDMGLRSELAPKFESKRTYLPFACYSLSKIEKKVFCETLSQLKVLDATHDSLALKVYQQNLYLKYYY